MSCVTDYSPAERNPIRTKARVNEIPIERIPVRTKIPPERTPIRTKSIFRYIRSKNAFVLMGFLFGGPSPCDLTQFTCIA